MSRYTDKETHAYHSTNINMELPIIDWERVQEKPPTLLNFNYISSDSKLPECDIVIITWTINEWSALDHVFINSDYPRHRTNMSWRKNWFYYSRNAPEAKLHSPLWGYYQLIEVNKKRVLLFKSDAHLARPYWLKGLSEMMRNLLADTQAKQVYTIGTAGGASTNEKLGDVVITDSAHIELRKSENTDFKFNNKTFTSKHWIVNDSILPEVEKQLFFKMSNIVTYNELNYLFYELSSKLDIPSKIELSGMITKEISPKNLHQSKAILSKGKPVLTTDYYYISESEMQQYSALEMDDAVVAYEAGKANADYVIVRNISDPIVPTTTVDGEKISNKIREEWSGLIYNRFGLFSSFNGALATWASIL